MSAILEEGIGYGGNATDAIVQAFETKIKGNVLAKTLAAAQDGKAPKFTDEEMAYLTKQAIQESPLAEMTVAVPSPQIILKKGKTELNIKNAATILQKMEEKYPTPKPAPPLQVPPEVLGNPNAFEKGPIKGTIKEEPDGEIESFELNSEDIDEMINELEEEVENEGKEFDGPLPEQQKANQSMVEKFKKCVNFPANRVSPEVAKSVAPDVDSFHATAPVGPPEIVKTVNRNAYEIREGVLSMAIDFIRWQTDMVYNLNEKDLSKVTIPDENKILTTAKKFYQFVENRR